MFKINNSYETEPSTSSSSSSNECLSILNAEWDYQKGNALKEFLFPSETINESIVGQRSKCGQSNKLTSPMVSSSQESDFYGFTPKSFVDPITFEKPAPENVDTDDEPHEHAQSELTTKVFGSSQTIGSEEFSDQDVRCRIDIEKNRTKLQTIIEDNVNLSDFTIEPTSSDDEDEPVCGEIVDDLADRAIVLKVEHSTCELPTLLVNENSNNAVDNAISNITYASDLDLTDLSFNGKLKVERPMEQTHATNTTLTNNEFQSDQKQLNISNAADLSNMGWKLQLETSREHINERSPDLFSDVGDLETDTNENYAIDETIVEETANVTDSIEIKTGDGSGGGRGDRIPDGSIEKREKAMSKRLQALLSGIIPPPSVTYIQHDIGNLLSMYKRNITLMDFPIITNDCTDTEARDDTTNNLNEHQTIPNAVKDIQWPELKRINEYGLHYNRTKYTDNIEIMYMKLVERNVGQETATSFTFDVTTSAKKKPARKLMASPGNRLSHLARRRAIFSSANLQSQSQLLSNVPKLGQKPCVIDTSKLSRKGKVATPKRRALAQRRTPGRKTPSSLKKSAKKQQLVTVAPKIGTATRETSKRALFLSPTHDELKNPIQSNACDTARRAEKSKRALFSPPRRFERSISNLSSVSSQNSSTSFSMLNGSTKKNTHDRIGFFNRANSDISISFKRRLEPDDDENMEPQRSKFQRTNHSLQQLHHHQHNNTLTKAASENSMYQSQQLSKIHKQKLLWAVSTALKDKSITSTNTNYINYAGVLGKVVKRLYLELLPTKTESTSKTMQGLANRLVYRVLKGKSVDEIYFEEKTRMNTSIATANKRPTGYINRDEYLLHLQASKKLSTSPHAMSGESGTEFYSTSNKKEHENDSAHKPLTNSSSKSNVGTSALRENHDTKSAQKSSIPNISFSGRNQKNLSPYNDKTRSISNLNKPNKLVAGTNSSISKVKRQICFDN